MTNINEAVASDAPDQDSFLTMLSRVANKFETAFPVTLTVGGSTISGTLVSQRRYFEELHRSLLEGNSEFALAIEELLKALPEQAPPAENDSASDETAENPPTHYIHLMDARIYTPGYAGMPANGVLWRGRLTAVNGFSYGAFKQA